MLHLYKKPHLLMVRFSVMYLNEGFYYFFAIYRGFNFYKGILFLVQSRDWITGNRFNKSFIKTIERPECTIPPISCNFTILEVRRVKPKSLPIY